MNEFLRATWIIWLILSVFMIFIVNECIKSAKKLCKQDGHLWQNVGESGHFVACKHCNRNDYRVFPIGTKRSVVTPEVAILINHLDEVDPKYLKDMIELYAKHIYEIGYRDAVKEIPHVVETI